MTHPGEDLRLRYLLVGLGNIGGKRRAVLGARCVATVDPYNAAADHRTPETCAPESYDAAILAVPNPVKVDLIRFFLDRGKHVLVEKPLVLDQAAADDLRRRASATGACWQTSYNFRVEPNVVALKRHLDAGDIGRFYRARMFYGNGTAGQIAGTWRDSRLGVLEDLASHLIDLTGFVFGRRGVDFQVWDRKGYELKWVDHVILATDDRSIVIETSFLSWRNTWRIEVIGEKGSLEMDGLTKWGDSRLVLRRRQFPSGPPEELVEIARGPDPTWAADLRHFEELAAVGETSCENDLWLSRTITKAAEAPLSSAAGAAPTGGER
jgi:predicted dehydrogenase